MNNRESLRAIGRLGCYTSMDTRLCKWADERIEELEQQLAERKKQIVILRDALLRTREFLETPADKREVTPYVEVCEALATTHDLKDCIICDAEPIAWQDCSGEPHRLHNDAMCSEEATPEPLYKARTK